MFSNPRVRWVEGGIVLLCLLISPLYAQEEPPKEKKEYLSVEELTKSKANQLYVTRRFAEAIEGFQKLAAEYPKDYVIQRYIGASLDHLERDEEAVAAFRKVLALNAEDLPSRQFLAKIYMRRAELEKAQQELEFIVDHDTPQGIFAWPAKSQLETIKRLREAAKKPFSGAGGWLSQEEFLRTDAAKLFIAAKYEKALKAFEALRRQYPGDVTVIRYHGLTFDKLRRFDEALAIYQSGLAQYPDNIPLHYFKAETLLHKADYLGAKQEFQFVVDRDETQAYKSKAQVQIAAIGQILEALRRPAPKRWSVSASSGVEYNTNPLSTTRVKALRSGVLQGGWKFSTGAGASLDLFRKGPWSGRASYNYSQALYSESFNQLNSFSNLWSINGIYSKTVKGKPLIVQLGHTTAHTLVRNRLYSVNFAENINLIYSLKNWWRVSLSERWGYTHYDSEGSRPDSTSKDGFGNTVGLTNTFYFNKARTLSAPLGFEYGRDDTQGVNYIKNAASYRTGLHFPLYLKWEGDLSFKFKDSYYPKWGDPNTIRRRRDAEYVLGVTLSRKFFSYVTFNCNYGYTNVNSRDDNYTYTGHVFGTSLSLSY